MNFKTEQINKWMTDGEAIGEGDYLLARGGVRINHVVLNDSQKYQCEFRLSLI